MTPIKNKTYLIQYVDFKYPEASYYGPAVFTGSTEEDSDESDLSKGVLYEFKIENLERHTNKFALFSEEDILKKIK